MSWVLIPLCAAFFFLRDVSLELRLNSFFFIRVTVGRGVAALEALLSGAGTNFLFLEQASNEAGAIVTIISEADRQGELLKFCGSYGKASH